MHEYSGRTLLALPVMFFTLLFCICIPISRAENTRVGHSRSADDAAEDLPEVAKLIEQLSSPKQNIRVTAANQLGAHAARAAAAVPELTKMLDAESIDERFAASGALGSIGESASPAVATLIRHLDDDGISFDGRGIWVSFSKALAGIGRPAIPAIIDALDADEPNVYKGLTVALQMMEHSPVEAGPALVEQLGRRDGELKIATLFALSNVGSAAEGAIPQLIVALDDDNFHVQYASCRVLASLGPRSATAVPKLLDLLQEGNASVRGNAALALGAIGPVDNHDTLAALLVALGDPTSPVRDRVLIGIGSLGGEARSAEKRIRKMVDSGNNRIEAAKTWFLITGGDPRALQALMTLSDDFGSGLDAIVAVGSLGPDAAPAVEMLLQKLDNEDESVRVESAIALGRIGAASRPALPRLREMTGSDSSDIRLFARQAIDKIESASDQ